MPSVMDPGLKPETDREHPVAAWVGIVAILVAILLILWARIEIHGTRDLERTLSADEPCNGTERRKPSPAADKKAARDSEVDDAVATGRWATGFHP
jgi:hypothetical protein